MTAENGGGRWRAAGRRLVDRVLPERWRRPEIVDPKTKPIEVCNLSHADTDTSNLFYFSRAMLNAVQGTDKQVAVFIENIDGIDRASRLIQFLTATSEGKFAPSEIINRVLTAELQQTSPGDEVNLGRGTRYPDEIVKRIDAIAADYPGKIVVVMEGNDPSKTSYPTSEETEEADDFIRQQVPYSADEAYFDAFRGAMATLVANIQGRDKNDAARLREVAADPTIGAIVKLHGTQHRSGDLLAAEGYSVTNADAEDVALYMPKSMLIARQFANPDRPLSDAEIRIPDQVINRALPLLLDESYSLPDVMRLMKGWMEEAFAEIDEYRAQEQRHKPEGPENRRRPGGYPGVTDDTGKDNLRLNLTEPKQPTSEATVVFDAADKAAGFESEPSLAERERDRKTRDRQHKPYRKSR